MPAKTTKKAKGTTPTASIPLAPPSGPMPPGGPIEIVFSFDTTGSMSRVLVEVRTKVQEVINRLFTDIPALKIAVFAHGDYCDKSNYITKYVDFTNDTKKLCHFVETVKKTGGGDFAECYELVLRQVRENLSWTPGTQRSLVMIGDAIPHDTKYPQNKQKFDWEVETDKLYKEMGVNIYAVQAGKKRRADHFWQGMAKKTNGKHLNLGTFETIVDMMMAICYRETGPDFFEAYEREVRAREGAGIRSELDHMFDALRNPVSGASTSGATASAVTPDMRRRLGRRRRSGAARKTTEDTSEAARKSTKRSRDDSDDDSADEVSTTVKKTRVAAKKPWSLKKVRSSSIVAAKLVKKAKISAAKKDSKKKRETVPQTRFILNSLKWTPWQTAMAAKPPSEDDETWAPRRGEHKGVRNVALFDNDTDCPAVYEFAVQAKQRCKKYPMYFSTTRGFSQQKWDTYLLKQEEINKEVDKVLKKGCKLYVRRAKVEKPVKCGGKDLSSVDELRSLIGQTYDYAWTAPRHVRDTHRQVTRNGVLISNRSC